MNPDRYPSVPAMRAKRDIEGAFRLRWVSPEDAELFAGELPWSPPGRATPGGTERADEEPSSGEEEFRQGCVAIYLVLSFGFAGP